MVRHIFLILSLFSYSQAFADSDSFPVKIPYDMIASYYNISYSEALNPYVRTQECNVVGTSEDDRPKNKQYNCGELPIGNIESPSLKQLIAIQTPWISKTTSSMHYHLNRGKIVVNMARSQKAGKIAISSLDGREQKLVEVSPSIGSDIFMMFRPQGGTLASRFCVGIPGMVFAAEKANYEGHFHKYTSWYLPDLCTHPKIDIDLGRGSFDSGRVCGDWKLTADERGQPTMELVEILTPSFTGVQHEGLKVDVHVSLGGFWGFISDVLGMFSFDIEDKIATEISKKIREEAQETIQVTQQQIKSGAWFKEHVNAVGVKKVVNAMSRKLMNESNSMLDGESVVERIHQLGCARITQSSRLNPHAQKQLFQLCTHALEVDVDWFTEDKESKERGCYSYMFNPTEVYNTSGVKRWWANNCFISHEVTVHGPTIAMDLHKCLAESYEQQVDPTIFCKDVLAPLKEMAAAGELAPYVSRVRKTEIFREPAYTKMSRSYRSGMVLPYALPQYETIQDLW